MKGLKNAFREPASDERYICKVKHEVSVTNSVVPQDAHVSEYEGRMQDVGISPKGEVAICPWFT